MPLKILFALASITILGLLGLSAPAIAGPYYLARGERALTEADAPAAIDQLAAAARWQPEGAEIQRRLAQAYLQAGQPEAALTAAQEALRLEPDAPESHLTLGDVYDQLNQPEPAVVHYEAGQVGDRAISLTINYLRLADEWWTEGRRAEAAAIWRDKVRSLGYGNLYANWRLNQHHAENQEAAQFYQDETRYFGLEEIAPLPDPRLTAYQTEAMLGLLAEGVWDRNTLLNVLSYRVWQDQGQAAEDLLQALIATYPDDPDLRFFQGELYHRRGDWAQAKEAYQQILDLDPDYAQAYLRLGLVAEAGCEPPAASCEGLREAADWYEQYRQLVPDDLLGLKKRVEIAETLGQQQANALREQFDSLIDDRQLVADLLNIAADEITFGPNLIANAGFESWEQQRPQAWLVSNTSLNPEFNAALFAGGADGLQAWDGASARSSGVWVQMLPDNQQPLYGYQQQDLPLKANTYYLVSFYFRAANVLDNTTRSSLISANPESFRAAAWLPPTNARWRKYGMLVKNDQPELLPVRQLLFLYGPGSEWLDQVEVKAVVLRQTGFDPVSDLPVTVIK